MHLEHPFLKKDKIEKRYYQESIIRSCKDKNSLVVLPTGIGKTIIAIGLVAQRLENYPEKKVLLLAPTKPLAEQHKKSLEDFLEYDIAKICLLTGAISPQKRKEDYESHQIVIATPQVIENDLIKSVINLNDYSIIVFDEAHRAIGNYAYTFIAKKYLSDGREGKILTALTASPGSNEDKINELCANLFIEHIEIRKENDPDIKPYVQTIDKKWIVVELTEQYKTAFGLLEKSKEKYMKSLRDAKMVFGSKISKKQLLMLQRDMMEKIRQDKNPLYFNYVSLISSLIKLNYLAEVLTTQGAVQAKQYADKLRLEQTKAVKSLFGSKDFAKALIHIEKLSERGEQHPKMDTIMELLEKHIGKNKKAIVFAQYVNTVEQIYDWLASKKGGEIRAVKFIGQRASNTQKQQMEILNKFRNDEYNVLISTSVGEEGLDIPKVDTVIFHEPIPSEIRTIQRRGRTGRQKQGSLYILITKDTIDEAYFWSSKAKEKKMHKTLKDMKNAFEANGVMKEAKKQPTVFDYYADEKKITIVADVRETQVNKKLSQLSARKNISLDVHQLKVADFILSDRLGVERKTVDDFVDSIIDKRLFEQLSALSSSFLRPVLMIEGEGDMLDLKYSRNIHPSAVMGAINSVLIDFRIPVYFTKNIDQSCELLINLAKREQVEKSRSVQLYANRKTDGCDDIQERIISSFPRINRNISMKLLDKFKSIKNIVNASLDKLVDVEGIGTLRAKKIKEVCEWERK
ncbi:MAG: DEAD/DEAH box helicase [Candidatus Aenigmarchaeota archaeon]|nr:DEAD/DEAH box helicase [Candidatus Aenigmarchaeota archaeon]